MRWSSTGTPSRTAGLAAAADVRPYDPRDFGAGSPLGSLQPMMTATASQQQRRPDHVARPRPGLPLIDADGNRLETDRPMARVEQERHHLLAPGTAEPIEHEERIAWHLTPIAGPVIIRPALGKLPHRSETFGTLRATTPCSRVSPAASSARRSHQGMRATRLATALRSGGRRRPAERAGEQTPPR